MARNSEKTRVLVCEDEDTIRDFVVLHLTREGFEVVDVNCGEEALRVFEHENGNFDVVVLDVMMPGIDGFTVLKEIRKKTEDVGIIMLTAKTQEMDQVYGLMQKADVYMSKPFSPSVLKAQIDRLAERTAAKPKTQEAQELLESGPFVLNPDSITVTKNGEPIELTPVEYEILKYFLQNKNTALDRSSILQQIWGDSYYGDNKIVDVNIRRLRMKIEDDPSDPKYIITIWGYGYKWEEKPEMRR